MSLPLFTSSEEEKEREQVILYISVMIDTLLADLRSAYVQHFCFPSQIIYIWQANKENAI